MRRVYLAGPMSGIQDFNYPAFFAESDRLSRLGFHVENPAANPECSDWQGYMRLSLVQMLTCDVVALLPGWEASRGTRLEMYVAKQLGMPALIASEITRPFVDTAPTSEGIAHG